MRLDHFEDPGAWLADQGGRVLRDGPDLTDEELAEPSRLLGSVKVEADNDVPLVIDRTTHAFGLDAALAATVGKRQERLLPGTEVADGVFDVQNDHDGSPVWWQVFCDCRGRPDGLGIPSIWGVIPLRLYACGVRAKAAAVHQQVVNLCRENSDSRTLRAAVLEEVRRLIAFEAYAWLLTDPETCVGSAPLAHFPDLSRLPQLIRLKYATAVNRWTVLKPNCCTTLAEATAGDLSRSLLWKNLLSSYGVTDIASIVFRDQFGCWGFLDLWRLGGSPAQFTEQERAFLSSLTADLTAVLRGCQAATFTGSPLAPAVGGPVVLLLSGELELLGQTPQADAHLRLLLPTSPGVAPVPAAAYNVAAQLLAREDGVDDGPPQARAHLAGTEWISLRAARLGEASLPGAGARERSP